jgi:hypothetical protein
MFNKLTAAHKKYSEITEKDGPEAFNEAIATYGQAYGLDMSKEENIKFVTENLAEIRKVAEGDTIAL